MAALSSRQLAATRAVAEAVFAGDETGLPGERLTWLVAEADDFIACSGGRLKRYFGLFLFVVSVLAPLYIRRLPPLRRLPLSRRVAALERFERSFAAGALLAVKAILSIIYYEHPEVARSIGYDGQCLREHT